MNLLYASSLALDSGPSPCASRLAVWSIAALSGLLPAAMISATAMAAAWKPLATAAWRMSSTSRPRSRGSIRSSSARVSSGNSERIGLSPHERGLRAMMASSESGSVAVSGLRPHLRSNVTIGSPSMERSSTRRARTPAMRRMECHFGPAR